MKQKRPSMIKRLALTDKWDILLMDDGMIHVRRVIAFDYKRKRWTISPLGEKHREAGRYTLTRFDMTSGKIHGRGLAPDAKTVAEITEAPITQEMLDEMEAVYLALRVLQPEGV